MFMVKDNHLAAGLDLRALQKMISAARAANPGVRVELEADTLAQVKSFFLLEGVDVILLDNMSLSDMREAVRSLPRENQARSQRRRQPFKPCRSIAETGVHFIL
jgi:nicotinate-nucleotide pyrophosphorylase (carboxylating)